MSINKTNNSSCSFLHRLSAVAFLAFATLAIAAPASAQIDLLVGGISESGASKDQVDRAYGSALRNIARSSAAGVPLGWDKVGSGMVLALLREDSESRSRTGIGGLEIVFKLVGVASSEGNKGGNAETTWKVEKGEK